VDSQTKFRVLVITERKMLDEKTALSTKT